MLCSVFVNQKDHGAPKNNPRGPKTQGRQEDTTIFAILGIQCDFWMPGSIVSQKGPTPVRKKTLGLIATKTLGPHIVVK